MGYRDVTTMCKQLATRIRRPGIPAWRPNPNSSSRIVEFLSLAIKLVPPTTLNISHGTFPPGGSTSETW